MKISGLELNSKSVPVLAMALRALMILRLDAEHVLVNREMPQSTLDYMNRIVAGTKDICDGLNMFVDNPDQLIDELIGAINVAANYDVYQSICQDFNRMDKKTFSE